ncbi:MAG: glutaredoxin 3 [Sphingomicrobium sp.]
MSVVEIYTKHYCPFCWRAMNVLASKEVEIVEIPIDGCGQKRALMIERANGRTTVPQIFIRGKHVGGCSELVRLEEDGRLDALLAG